MNSAFWKDVEKWAADEQHSGGYCIALAIRELKEVVEAASAQRATAADRLEVQIDDLIEVLDRLGRRTK